MNIRTLTVEDSEAILSVIKDRGTFQGVQSELLETHMKFSHMSLVDLVQNPSQGKVYGAFEGDELKGFIVTILSDQQPCYFVRRAQTVHTAKLETLSLLFAYLIQDYESRGLNRFYTLYKKDNIGVYHRLWRTTEVLKNYVTYTDMEIAPNTRPKHYEVWDSLCGRTLTPDTLVVRGFIRKSDTMFFNEDRL
jgi:hypothetical protein